VLNAKYTSSNQVTSHPYLSGLHVAKNWNKKQLVFYMKAEKMDYSLLDHVIVQSHTWLPTFSYNSVCMGHIITESTDTVLHSLNMNRMTCFHQVTETSHSLPVEINPHFEDIPLWALQPHSWTHTSPSHYPHWLTTPITYPVLLLYNITFISNSLSSHYPQVKRRK